MQDPHLFHDTIRENLRYARPEATDDELIEACRAARIHDLIAVAARRLRHRRRRARATGSPAARSSASRSRGCCSKAPAIVILDEATSHLDTESEHAIQQALTAALAGRTALVIAHRLSTIVNADRIIVIDDGQIVDEGTHRDLLRRGGLYADLYRTQIDQLAEAPGAPTRSRPPDPLVRRARPVPSGTPSRGGTFSSRMADPDSDPSASRRRSRATAAPAAPDAQAHPQRARSSWCVVVLAALWFSDTLRIPTDGPTLASGAVSDKTRGAADRHRPTPTEPTHRALNPLQPLRALDRRRLARRRARPVARRDDRGHRRRAAAVRLARRQRADRAGDIDWPEHAQEQMDELNPEVVVFIIGTNDANVYNDSQAAEYAQLDRADDADPHRPTAARSTGSTRR